MLSFRFVQNIYSFTFDACLILELKFSRLFLGAIYLSVFPTFVASQRFAPWELGAFVALLGKPCGERQGLLRICIFRQFFLPWWVLRGFFLGWGWGGFSSVFIIYIILDSKMFSSQVYRGVLKGCQEDMPGNTPENTFSTWKKWGFFF